MMKSKITVITIVLTIIIIVPILFFSVLEISRFEKEMERNFKFQLGTYLRSINNYSREIIDDWANKISANQPKKNENICDAYKSFFKERKEIRSIVFCDCNTNAIIASCFSDSLENERITIERLQKLRVDSSKKIDRLYRYSKAAGYRKFEPFGYNIDSSLFIVFMLNNTLSGDSSIQGCIIEVDSKKFVENLLFKKIQSIADDSIIDIGIIENKTNRIISSSGKTDKKNYLVKKAFWLFPQYKMGIAFKGKSIETINKQRNRFNVFLIIFADVLFILGAIFIFRNIKKEMKLTLIKSEFISNVSHEIRTPLALISMYIETLEMDRIKNEEKKKEYYRVIYNETQRLSGLVNKILNFSKMESGKRKFSFSKANINDVVGDVLKSYKFHLQSKGFELKLELNDQLQNITIDREAISDCIVNLIDNAIKYSRENKEVSIKTGKTEGFVFVQVTDKGIGINRDDQRLVFEKFFRVAKGDNVHDVKGTGLGLTIVKGIVEAHKGRVEVESKLGAGSTFTIKLPEI